MGPDLATVSLLPPPHCVCERVYGNEWSVCRERAPDILFCCFALTLCCLQEEEGGGGGEKNLTISEQAKGVPKKPSPSTLSKEQPAQNPSFERDAVESSKDDIYSNDDIQSKDDGEISRIPCIVVSSARGDKGDKDHDDTDYGDEDSEENNEEEKSLSGSFIRQKHIIVTQNKFLIEEVLYSRMPKLVVVNIFKSYPQIPLYPEVTFLLKNKRRGCFQNNSKAHLKIKEFENKSIKFLIWQKILTIKKYLCGILQR